MFTFTRVLALVSPRHMRDGDPTGEGTGTYGDVTPAQRLLGKNKFGEFYHLDEPQHRDEAGVFGPNTAEACYWARYWMGYPKKGETSYKRRRFDERMAKRLTGERKLRPLFRARRARRIKASQVSLGQKALEIARKRIGEHEVPPGSNKTQTTKRWGFTGAWCAMFVSECYLDAGSKTFKLGAEYAYNPTLRAACKAGHAGMQFVPQKQAEPGDIVQLDLNDGTEPPDHACLFVKWDGNDVVTLDGNWGDDVGYEHHPRSAVMDIIRVTE